MTTVRRDATRRCTCGSNAPAVCRHCAEERRIDTPLSSWIRRHPRLDSSANGAALSITDLDFVIHKYVVRDDKTGVVISKQHLMLVEEKAHGANVSVAQGDTLRVLDQLIRNGPALPLVQALRGSLNIKYHGLHVLRLSNTTPENSDAMWWDDKEISDEMLVELLTFRRDAHTLKPREERNHHTQRTLPLVGLA